MVTIGMNYRVLPGKEEIFESAFEKVVKAMSGIDGHGETHMYREISDSKTYLIVSQWNSKPALASSKRSAFWLRTSKASAPQRCNSQHTGTTLLAMPVMAS